MRAWTRALICSAAVMAGGAAADAGSTWPTRPIRIVVPFGAGTGLDVMARAFAQRLGEQTAATVIVDNKEGAGGTIGAVATAHAPADGYTLMFTAHAPFAVAPYLQEGGGYDPIADFTPITKVAVIPMALITGSTSSYKRFEDVVAAARSRPGKLDYASSGIGTPSHLHMEVIKQKLGLDIVAVPYKSTGQAMTDLIGGQTALYMPSLPAALPQIRSGQVRALAVGSAQRAKALPNVPTVAELLQAPGLEASVWYGFLAPRGLPPDAAQRIHAELARAAASPQIQQLADALGAELVLVGPSDFRLQVSRDAESSRQLLMTLGVARRK